MGRNVEINVPMFIGIILLVAAVTAMLVFGTKKVEELMEKNNPDYVRETNIIEEWIFNNKMH